MSMPKISVTDLFDIYELDPGVTALSTRRGFVANPSDPYSGFNACHYTGDDSRHVSACRYALCEYLGIDAGSLVIPRQTHSLDVRVVTADNIASDFDSVDGLVTRERGVALAVNTADCVPVLLADTVNGVIAAVHSGWRGTVGEILLGAVRKMSETGAEPRFIKAVMGPSICGGCFEVGDDVAGAFRRLWNRSDVVLERWLQSAGKYHVDLRQACRLTLLRAGIPECNITAAAPCSRCNSENYFSARSLGPGSGRTLSVIMLN